MINMTFFSKKSLIIRVRYNLTHVIELGKFGLNILPYGASKDLEHPLVWYSSRKPK